MKVLGATVKPFAKVAVDGIRKVIEDAGYELALLENYTEKSDLLKAVADADAGGVCRVALNLDYALESCEDELLAEAGALEKRQDSLELLLAAIFPDPRLVPALIRCLERVEAPKNIRLI